MAELSQTPQTVAQPDRYWLPRITFMFYPDRKFAADKKDAATIYATLADVAPWDIAFSLMSSIGPETILIRKGNDHGEAQLVADRPGTVSVNFLGSRPWPREIYGIPMKIKFVAPVAGLSIRASPRSIELFQFAEIAIELINGDGVSVPTDETREIWLAVDSGGGEFDDNKINISANQYRVTTKFRPFWPGSVRLVAESGGLRGVPTDLTVATPTLILILCGIGGLAGGWLALLSQNAHWPRIPVGIFTGFVLYWLLLFGLVHVPSFPHGVVFNPYSAFVLPLLGGWGGTKVLTFGLKQLGIDW